MSFDANCRKAKKIHLVQSGESIARIADYYGVSQRDLLALNNMPKGKALRNGQKLLIPNVLRVSGKKYEVKKGDSLASIAQKFKRTPKEIAGANKMKLNSPIKEGRVLVIPDKDALTSSIKVKGKKLAPILFLRVRTGERERLRLYNAKGKVDHKSLKRLSYLTRDKKDNKVKRLNFRLIKMIQEIAEAFPGKPIEIISGYRATSSGAESQHAFGRAIDFRIPGVSGKKIFSVCKSLSRSGCGYYPNAGFVHMDAREKKTTWIDRSH